MLCTGLKFRYLRMTPALLMAAGTLAGRTQTVQSIAPITNLVELREAASPWPLTNHTIRLEGTVWWAAGSGTGLVLSDSSRAEVLELNAKGASVHTGDRVRLMGQGTVVQRGARLQIGVVGPVVDNDGEHDFAEKSGAVYLSAGLNPLRLEWFNGVERFDLKLEWEGPGVARQAIPGPRLFRSRSDTGEPKPGLDYQAYEGRWQALPAFDELTPVQSGVVSNFDLSVLSRPENAALVFTGHLSVPRAGLYMFHLTSDDGSRLYVGRPTLSLQIIGQGSLPTPQRLAMGQTLLDSESGQWVKVEGKVRSIKRVGEATLLELRSAGGSLRVEIGDDSNSPPASLLNRKVQVEGFCLPALTSEGEKIPGEVLVPDFTRVLPMDTVSGNGSSLAGGSNEAGLPVLTSAVEVHQLKREEAERGYSVKLRGVVTSVLPEYQAFTLQDSTRGLYVEDWSEYRSRPAQVGEFLEVEGTTDPSKFAPIVKARLVRSLGLGRMPEPVKPTYDQLMNGSLDAQFVELQGIVTAVHSNSVSLLTRDGVISVELRVPGLRDGELAAFENALVRVRGCLFASWDYVTHQVKLGEVRVYDANLTVDQPPPEDLFATPAKSAADLLLFDPQAGAFQRVKVSGQIVHVRGTEHFLMDGSHGLRVMMMKPAAFKPGDLVEVVGFPELFGGASPILREAVGRKIGHAALPEAPLIGGEDLINAAHDSTLVRVEGVLAGVRHSSSGLVLEMQSGVRSFAARLNPGMSDVPDMSPGTRLELCGVYAGHGGNHLGTDAITSFELLLNAPADIRVLAWPPWWTLKRLLIIVGLLACVLAATMLWITQLRRQVEQRSAELASQIKEREHVEHQHAIEQERARIAQDLHDELGSGITEISMLAARAKAVTLPDARRSRYLDEVWDKAREMVTALDEIVWAMDPHHDSLSSLVSYFSLYADRFLGLAGIAWHLEGPSRSSDLVVSSRYRHQLFLVFKEALNNVVRHSGASEVRLRIQVEADEIRCGISDNGSGLDDNVRTENMSGVANMRARVERLGGRFSISSESNRSTTVQFSLPSNEQP